MSTLLLWILIAAFLIPILLMLLHIHWMNLHKYALSIYSWEAGVKRIKTQRYRLKKGLFYKPSNIFGKKPSAIFGRYTYFYAHTVTPFFSYFPYWKHKSMLFFHRRTETVPITYDDIQPFIIPIEAGWGSPKNVCKFNTDMMPWCVSSELETSGHISNDMVIKVNELREELYETTKNPLTTQEMLAKIMIPLGLIILAIVCVIFFPKIYHTIQDSTIQDYSVVRQGVLDIINSKRPLG